MGDCAQHEAELQTALARVRELEAENVRLKDGVSSLAAKVDRVLLENARLRAMRPGEGKLPRCHLCGGLGRVYDAPCLRCRVTP